VLFNVFINDLNTEVECILRNFAGDTKLRGDAESLEGKEGLDILVDMSAGKSPAV